MLQDLIFIGDCKKWCSNCFIIYTGCRYRLTTNVILKLQNEHIVRNKREFSIIITICYTRFKVNNHQISDCINHINKDSSL